MPALLLYPQPGAIASIGPWWGQLAAADQAGRHLHGGPAPAAKVAPTVAAPLKRLACGGVSHPWLQGLTISSARLPEGSASYYFRTRQALLQATVERLADLDMAEIPARHRDLDTFARAAAELVQGWLTSGRERQLARFELALEATRRPELREALVASGARIRAMVAELFAAAGVSEPTRRASDFAAFLDGLLFDQIAGAGARERSSAELCALIRALLTAVTARHS